MSDNITFRQANTGAETVKPVVKPAEPVAAPTPQKDGEMSPLVWAKTAEKPYVAHFLGVEATINELPIEYREHMQEIQQAYEAKVKGGQLKDSVEAFRHFWKRLEMITDTEYSPLSTKLQKITDFIKTINEHNKK